MHYTQEKLYALNPDKIQRGEDRRTTLMIKNIPNKYTQKVRTASAVAVYVLALVHCCSVVLLIHLFGVLFLVLALVHCCIVVVMLIHLFGIYFLYWLLIHACIFSK
jgi:predicted tellurium resistance membrane protein TerC